MGINLNAQDDDRQLVQEITGGGFCLGSTRLSDKTFIGMTRIYSAAVWGRKSP